MTQIDLFVTKSKDVKDFIKLQTLKYLNDLATEGRIKRISDEEKNFRFNTKEDIWEFVK